MNLIAVFLLVIPGFLAEYLYESALSQGTVQQRWPDALYRILRGLFLNVPITIIVWLVICAYKYAHGYPMIKGYNQFIEWAMSGVFLLRYSLVIFAELAVFYIASLFARRIASRKK